MTADDVDLESDGSDLDEAFVRLASEPIADPRSIYKALRGRAPVYRTIRAVEALPLRVSHHTRAGSPR